MPPFVRFADLVHLVREHLPVPQHVVAPEHIEVPEHIVEAAKEVGKEALDLGVDAVKDQAQDQADPDPTPWLWDHDPFTPGLQLTSDPLLVDVGDHVHATDLLLPDLHHLPDLPDDGLHTALG